jgi:hydroxymethylpyrimidine/phosphomethylpyrimidine kinase
MSSSPPFVLTFAASDPTGGAGLQADLLTLAALGCHPLSVVTALTVQDTRGVDSIDAVDASLVERQAAALLAEMKVAAFKLGVLGSEANARAVAAIVASHPRVPLVVDPVLASGRGDPLASDALIARCSSWSCRAPRSRRRTASRRDASAASARSIAAAVTCWSPGRTSRRATW